MNRPGRIMIRIVQGLLFAVMVVSAIVLIVYLRWLIPSDAAPDPRTSVVGLGASIPAPLAVLLGFVFLLSVVMWWVLNSKARHASRSPTETRTATVAQQEMIPNHFGTVVYFLVTRLVLPGVACGVLVLLGGAAILGWARLSPSYTAEVVIEIRVDPVVQATVQEHEALDQRRHDIEKRLEEDLRSRAAIEQVIIDVDRLNQRIPCEEDGTPTASGSVTQEELIDRLLSCIVVSELSRTEEAMRAEVSVTENDASLAASLANRIVDNYIERTNVRADRMLKMTKDFFERQRDLYAQMLAKAEAERLQFVSDNPGFDPDDRASVDDKLDSLEARLRKLTQEIVVLAAERDAVTRFVDEQPETIVNKVDESNPALARLHARRAELVARHGQLRNERGRPADHHPTVQSLVKEIAELDEQIARTKQAIQIDRDPVPNLERLRAQRALEEKSAKIVALQKQRSELAQQQLIYEVRKRHFLQLRERAVRLKRTIGELRTQYGFWNSRLRDADVDLQAGIGRQSITLTVLSRPPEILKPNMPDISAVWPIAGWVALIGGFVFCVTQLVINAIAAMHASTDEH